MAIGKRKQKLFKIYQLWLSLPPILLGEDADKLRKQGIASEQLLKLLSVTTKTQFRDVFFDESDGSKLSWETIAKWDRKIEEEPALLSDRMKWAKELTSNVLYSLYRQAMLEGDAARVKLFMQLVESWVEKKGIEHSGGVTIADILEELDDEPANE